MTVIRPNSISGINSITANGGDVNLFRADGTAADVTVNNITSGVITATTFKGAVEGNITGNTIAISIAGGGGSSAFTTSVTGIQTAAAIVGIGTTTTDDAELQGIGNSARGLYVSNGMILYDNAINGNHYIGTSMNGLMAGPVSVNGVLSVDGNFVVV